MAFSFGFSAEEEEIDGIEQQETLSASAAAGAATTASSLPSVPSVSLSLTSLLSWLPERLSYSTVKVGGITLPRRDLFDARFQMVCEGEEPIGVESDLIPGQYEGGLKTWECSLDLVGVLEEIGQTSSYHGKRIVELGCGTALPSLYLLQRLLTTPPPPSSSSSRPTYLHLCDFNTHVLTLVTLPNLLLAYHFATAEPSDDAGEVDVTDELVEAFQASLQERRIHLAFHAGPWEGLDLGADGSEENQSEQGGGTAIAGQPTKTAVTADLILTSETVYNPSGIATLIEVMRNISAPSPPSSTPGPHAPLSTSAATSLVATKNYYFGLGGGVHALLAGLEEDDRKSGWKHVTREERAIRGGVARSVLSVSWCGEAAERT